MSHTNHPNRIKQYVSWLQKANSYDVHHLICIVFSELIGQL